MRAQLNSPFCWFENARLENRRCRRRGSFYTPSFVVLCLPAPRFSSTPLPQESVVRKDSQLLPISFSHAAVLDKAASTIRPTKRSMGVGNSQSSRRRAVTERFLDAVGNIEECVTSLPVDARFEVGATFEGEARW